MLNLDLRRVATTPGSAANRNGLGTDRRLGKHVSNADRLSLDSTDGQDSRRLEAWFGLLLASTEDLALSYQRIQADSIVAY
jgi:hypothetical protein